MNLVAAACRLAAGRAARRGPRRRPRAAEGTSPSRHRSFRSRASPAPTRSSGRRCARPARSWPAPATSRPPSRRPSGRRGARCRAAGPLSSPCARATSPPRSYWADSLAALGFSLCATGGTASALAAAGLAVTRVRKVSEDGDGPTVVDLVRRRKVELVVNTPDGRGARSDGYLIREAALLARVPCVTTISGAAAAVEAIARATRGRDPLPPGTCRPVGLGSSGSSRSVPTRSSASSAGDVDPGIPGQFFMLRPPGLLLPRPMSLCLAPPGELGFLVDPVGPGTRALAALRDRGGGGRIRPARQRLRPRRGAAAARRRRHRRRAVPLPLASSSAALPRSWASARRTMRRRPHSSPTPRSSWSRPTSPRRWSPASTSSPAARSRCSGRARARPACPARLGGARWPAATAPATDAPSRSTGAWRGFASRAPFSAAASRL